jgi:hypothetical protein
MRKFILVAAAVVTTAFTFNIPAAYADTVIVKTSHHGYHRPHHRRCWTKTVRHRDRHGHIVVRKTRVCR